MNDSLAAARLGGDQRSHFSISDLSTEYAVQPEGALLAAQVAVSNEIEMAIILGRIERIDPPGCLARVTHVKDIKRPAADDSLHHRPR